MKTTDIRYIVLHCSATRSTQDYSPETLERDHRGRGFRGIGYHYYVRRSGEVIPCRPLDQIGAHVRGYNACSWAAGEPPPPPSPAQGLRPPSAHPRAQRPQPRPQWRWAHHLRGVAQELPLSRG